MTFFLKFKAALLHPFSHDIAILQVGIYASRLIAFGTSLAFARLLGPEGYGFYSLVFALGAIFTSFLDLGTGQGVTNLLARSIHERKHQEVKTLLAFFTKLSLIILATTGIISVLLAPWVGLWFYHNFYLGQLASIVVATTALTLFFPLIQIVLQVLRRIKQLTFIETLNKLITSLVSIALIVIGLSVFGIVIAQLLSMIIISIIAVFIYSKLVSQETYLPSIKQLFTTKISWPLLKYYFNFGFLIAISKNLVKLNAIIPLLILGAVLTTNSGLAFYKIAFAYISLPTVLLGPVSRLLNVQFPQTANFSQRQLFKRFWQVNYITIAICLVLTAGALLLGPWLIEFFYGKNFLPSVKLMYGLSLYPVLSAMGVGLGPMFRTLNKMKSAIIINIITFVLLVPTAYYLITELAIAGLIITTLLFTLIPNAISLVYFYRLSKHATLDTNLAANN